VSVARALRGVDVVRLVALAALWGGSFIFFRVLSPVLGPLATAALRVLIAGGALVAWFTATGLDFNLRAHGRQYALIGIVNSAIPFTLFGYAALYLPASYSAILNAATPLFAIALSTLILHEPLTPPRLAGLALGIGGVALVTRAGPVVPDLSFALAVLACLGATFCYAASGVYIKRWGGDLVPRAIAACSQLIAGVVLLPLALAAPLPSLSAITPAIVGHVLALALLCSAVAYLLYYRLIADVGPTRAMTVTFLIPLFGMVWGSLFLDEQVTTPMLAGCALILAGTLLVLRPAHRQPGAT
jgi:drug/metabolite transporter (DMT)-like permease